MNSLQEVIIIIIIIIIINYICCTLFSFVMFRTLEWIWSMRQLYINNLPTVIIQLNPGDQSGFETLSSG